MTDEHWILTLYERYVQLYGEIPLNTPSQSPAVTQPVADGTSRQFHGRERGPSTSATPPPSTS